MYHKEAEKMLYSAVWRGEKQKALYRDLAYRKFLQNNSRFVLQFLNSITQLALETTLIVSSRELFDGLLYDTEM